MSEKHALGSRWRTLSILEGAHWALQAIWERHSREAAARDLQRVDNHNRRKQIMHRAFTKVGGVHIVA